MKQTKISLLLTFSALFIAGYALGDDTGDFQDGSGNWVQFEELEEYKSSNYFDLFLANYKNTANGTGLTNFEKNQLDLMLGTPVGDSNGALPQEPQSIGGEVVQLEAILDQNSQDGNRLLGAELEDFLTSLIDSDEWIVRLQNDGSSVDDLSTIFGGFAIATIEIFSTSSNSRQIPIDGGLSLLALAGIAYGVRKSRKVLSA